MRIILASKSPRRVEILRNVGAEFDIMPADADESVPAGTSPQEAVCEISRRKAVCIMGKLKADNKADNVFIISADTVVVSDGETIGKPTDNSHAYRILKNLSGRTHCVLTGFTLCTKDDIYSDFVKTDVDFRELSDDEIYAYIASGEPNDKAGAYGIQEKGSVFVTGIHGDYFNVMGLPICQINTIAKQKFNIQLVNF